MGTTRVKAIAFSREGRILAALDGSYPMHHPEPGFAEQDPDLILRETIQVLDSLVAKMGVPPMAIVFSSAMHSLMALDEKGSSISPLIIWADNRSGSLADQLRMSEAGRQQYLRTGVPIHAMTPACKLLWINQKKPENLYQAKKYAGIKDYIILRLTGELLTDYSMAGATGLMNLSSLQWDNDTLQSLQINEGQLPEIVSPYTMRRICNSPDYANLAGIPIIVGGSDGCLANLGSGAIEGDSFALTIGTSGAIRRTSSVRHVDPEMRTFCYPLDTETFILGGPTNNGGVVFQWLKDQFFGDLSIEQMLEGVDRVGAGADGLMFFPYLLGERAPLWDSAARGCYHGIDMAHTRFHFARAAMEGVLMNLREIGSVLAEKEKITRIYASGGFTQSPEYVRMLADVFGMDVVLNNTGEAGCIGAALLGLHAIGEIADYSDLRGFVEIAETVPFNEERHQAYNQHFRRFQKLLHEVPFRINDFRGDGG